MDPRGIPENCSFRLEVSAQPGAEEKFCRTICSACERTTNHRILASVKQSVYSDVEWDGEVAYQIVRCEGCFTISYREAFWFAETRNSNGDFGDEPGQEERYPPYKGVRPLQMAHIPERVFSIYHETHSAYAHDLRVLTGIGIRALVEAVCLDREATGETLFERINSLVTCGLLTPDGARILHATRTLGNRAAHEIIPPTQQELEDALAVADHLLNTAYVLPVLGDRMSQRMAHREGAE